MILAQIVTLTLMTSNYQHPAVDPGNIQVTPTATGFTIELQGADAHYPYHPVLEADIEVQATYNFGGPSRFFFSPTGITDDESKTGIYPIGQIGQHMPVLYTREPGTVRGTITVDTFGVPARFEVRQ